MEALTGSLATSAMPAGYSQWTMILFVVLMVRSAIWKWIGLWKAGTKKQMTWFIVMFILNTVGILPIVYLAFFQKKEKTAK